MDYKRSLHDIQVARDYVKWEKENPDKILIESSFIPIPEKIRTNASELFAIAYHHIRERIFNKELVYQTVVASILDYSDRFGTTFSSLDDIQKEQILLSCDRITEQIPGEDYEVREVLPENPPPGFTREILDALDSAVRHKSMYVM